MKPHMPPSDINALRAVLTDIHSRLTHANRF